MINLNNGVELFDPQKDYKNSDIVSIVIPDGITTISKSTFSDCKSLKSVTIPESVATIGESAFW